jgi:hypothetical protein
LELTKLPMFGLSLYGIAFRSVAGHKGPRLLAVTGLALTLAGWTRTDSFRHGSELWHTDAGELA